MYLYDKDSFGECKSTSKWARVGKGKDPIGLENELCPLLRDMHGRYLDWTDYVVRTGSSEDKLSRFKKFLNEECYRDYLEMCRRRHAQMERRKQPSPSLTPPPGFCREKCTRERERCPGGRRNTECQRKFRVCMRDCEGVLV